MLEIPSGGEGYAKENKEKKGVKESKGDQILRFVQNSNRQVWNSRRNSNNGPRDITSKYLNIQDLPLKKSDPPQQQNHNRVSSNDFSSIACSITQTPFFTRSTAAAHLIENHPPTVAERDEGELQIYATMDQHGSTFDSCNDHMKQFAKSSSFDSSTVNGSRGFKPRARRQRLSQTQRFGEKSLDQSRCLSNEVIVLDENRLKNNDISDIGRV